MLVVVCRAVVVGLVVLPAALGDRWRAGSRRQAPRWPASWWRSSWWRASWWRGPWSGRRRREDESAADRSLELLVADLRRLEREFRRTEQDSELSYRTARLQAISLAYDDTLLLCCRLLDVPEPERPPWTPVTRLQIEAELARAGLDW